MSKKKISGYQKLKQRVAELEDGLEAMLLRPHSSQAKSFRVIFKLEKNID